MVHFICKIHHMTSTLTNTNRCFFPSKMYRLDFELKHVNSVLKSCHYPDLSLKKVSSSLKPSDKDN